MNLMARIMTNESKHLGQTYSMTQLCTEFSVTPRALRFYEQRKLLKPMRSGSTRVFNHRDRARLKLVLRGKRYGFTLTEIKEMLDLYDAPGGKEKQLKVVLPKLQSQMNELKNEHDELGQILAELENNCRELSASLNQPKQ